MARSILRGAYDRALPLVDRPLRCDERAAGRQACADDIRVAIVGLPHCTGELRAAAVDGLGRALIAAYRQRGIGLLDDLHGTFALALVDDRRDEVLLAVDRVGIETLCIAADGSRWAFANDAGAAAAALTGDAVGPSKLADLDPQALFDYLYFHCIPGPSTVFRGVTRVLAGHYVRIDRHGIATAPYWSPSYVEDRVAPLAALEEEFLETVKSSVARAVEGATRPGCFLSGGTDSSTIAGLLEAVTGTPANSYSIGFDAEGFDEMRYARIAARRYGTIHHEYYITPSDLVDSIPRIAAAYDQPFGNSSVLPTYYCARMAAADGVDRLLGGDGGDELFGGNTRYAKQRVFDYYDRSPGPVRDVARALLAPAAWQAVPLVRKARSYVQQAAVPMPDRLQTYNLLTRVGADAIFTRDFLATVDVDAPPRAMRAWYARAHARTLLNRMLAFDFKYTLTDNDLPKVMTACRVAGVDVAFPLLDDALIAFAERLDPKLKLKGFKLRWFFKQALRHFLPPEILTKSKHGFGLPFGIWLGRDAGLKALAFDSLDALKRRGIVSPTFIDRLRADLLADHATYYGELVWVLMMLEQWLHAHAAGGATIDRGERDPAG